jgi:hypothetical protein
MLYLFSLMKFLITDKYFDFYKKFKWKIQERSTELIVFIKAILFEYYFNSKIWI